MPNITMKIDDKLLKKARKIAIDKETTLTGMIRHYLERLVDREEMSKSTVIAELEEVFSTHGVEIGKIKWSREELHER